MTTEMPASPSRTVGSQTLARGLEALKAIADARDGLAINDVGELLGVHRTIAYRILNTLSDAKLIHRSDDNRYRGAAGLLQLTSAAHDAIRAAALPVLHDVANDLASTVSLLIREGNDAVALAVVEPRGPSYHVSFAQGSRHPLNRGAAGLAIQASQPPLSSEAEEVRIARANGFAITFGEVEPNMYGLAAPIKGSGPELAACINLITTRREVAEGAATAIVAAAERISSRLG
ncbi:helix-turn-helix domain-containing protein [Pseudarthrobacter sulfonivorans]|uniref:IclR family transcriptional regulator n=1 Tax=Pseudarthrobacter sulfonivorans TaxID=121292 RepID=UPI00295EDAB5|nr:helix-turn-helix domain-containing protein [Pseudarthrobacter sulfonivorans]